MIAHDVLERGAREAAQLELGRRLGRERVLGQIGVPDEVGRILQADDLQASVLLGFDQLDDARDDDGEPTEALVLALDHLSDGNTAMVRNRRQLTCGRLRHLAA